MSAEVWMRVEHPKYCFGIAFRGRRVHDAAPLAWWMLRRAVVPPGWDAVRQFFQRQGARVEVLP